MKRALFILLSFVCLLINAEAQRQHDVVRAEHHNTHACVDAHKHCGAHRLSFKPIKHRNPQFNYHRPLVVVGVTRQQLINAPYFVYVNIYGEYRFENVYRGDFFFDERLVKYHFVRTVN